MIIRSDEILKLIGETDKTDQEVVEEEYKKLEEIFQAEAPAE